MFQNIEFKAPSPDIKADYPIFYPADLTKPVNSSPIKPDTADSRLLPTIYDISLVTDMLIGDVATGVQASNYIVGINSYVIQISILYASVAAILLNNNHIGERSWFTP